MGLQSINGSEGTSSRSTLSETRDERKKKRSWWGTVENWFIRKLGKKNSKENDEQDGTHEEEIIFVERTDLPSYSAKHNN